MAITRHPTRQWEARGIFEIRGAELRVPIDPSVEIVLFSISVPCLQVAHILRRSGLLASGEDVTEVSHFRAERMAFQRIHAPLLTPMR